MYRHFDWGYLCHGVHTHITLWMTTITAMNSSLTVDDIPVASLGNREPEKDSRAMILAAVSRCKRRFVEVGD